MKKIAPKLGFIGSELITQITLLVILAVFAVIPATAENYGGCRVVQLNHIGPVMIRLDGNYRRKAPEPYRIGAYAHTPMTWEQAQGFIQEGQASWYGPGFHGRQTANGEIFDQNALTMAHPTLPIPSCVKVTNLKNGRSVVLRVNDRGPFMGQRIADLSRGAAELLAFEHEGLTVARLEVLSPLVRR